MVQAVPTVEERKPLMQRLLDVVERVGNKVPHTAMIFLLLIGLSSSCPASFT
jgi:aminobenzoyl-glutamate transport protein